MFSVILASADNSLFHIIHWTYENNTAFPISNLSHLWFLFFVARGDEVRSYPTKSSPEQPPWIQETWPSAHPLFLILSSSYLISLLAAFPFKNAYLLRLNTWKHSVPKYERTHSSLPEACLRLVLHRPKRCPQAATSWSEPQMVVSRHHQQAAPFHLTSKSYTRSSFTHVEQLTVDASHLIQIRKEAIAHHKVLQAVKLVQVNILLDGVRKLLWRSSEVCRVWHIVSQSLKMLHSFDIFIFLTNLVDIGQQIRM